MAKVEMEVMFRGVESEVGGAEEKPAGGPETVTRNAGFSSRVWID
ncbi:MAG: hypothetical protein MPW15_25660 [Candidatus Manganitrophus sp.]|nr:hypothetical protein [Candidatus Manganitrophus sp.]